MGGINICILLLNIKKKITIFLKVYEEKFRIYEEINKNKCEYECYILLIIRIYFIFLYNLRDPFKGYSYELSIIAFQ